MALVNLITILASASCVSAGGNHHHHNVTTTTTTTTTTDGSCANVIVHGKDYISALDAVTEADLPESYTPGDEDLIQSILDSKRPVDNTSPPSDGQQNCKVKFEVQHLQDLSSSFTHLIEERQDLVEKFTDQLTTLFPGSSYGWSTFSDKPLPYMGYGDFADINDHILHDICYSNTYPLNTGDNLGDLINLDNLHILGGYDHMENTLAATMAGVLDHQVGWSQELVVDDTITVRVQFIFVDAIPHIGESDNGGLRQSAQSNINFWNDDFMCGDNVRDTYVYSFGECEVNGSIWTEGSSLREKYDNNTLTVTEQSRFDEIIDLCGPFPFADMSPFDIVQYSQVYNEAGVPESVKDEVCKTMEYPTWSEWADFFRGDEKMVLPVFMTHAINDGLIPLYHYYDVCDESVADGSICLADFYRNKLAENNVTGLAFAMTDISDDVVGKSTQMMGFVMDMLNAVYSELDCGCDQPPTDTPCITGDCGCDQLAEGNVEIRAKISAEDYLAIKDLNNKDYSKLRNRSNAHSGQSASLESHPLVDAGLVKVPATIATI